MKYLTVAFVTVMLVITNCQNNYGQFSNFAMPSFDMSKFNSLGGGSQIFGSNNIPSMSQQSFQTSQGNQFNSKSDIIQNVQGNSNTVNVDNIPQQIQLPSNRPQTIQQVQQSQPIQQNFQAQFVQSPLSAQSTISTQFVQNQQLLSASQIESLIHRNRAQDILEVMKKALSSSNKCEVKAAYVNDLLGKVLIGIEVKKFSVINLNSLIQAAQIQIEKLKSDSANAQAQQINLNINGLKQKLDSLVAKMKDAQSNFKACNTFKQKQDVNNLQMQLSGVQQQSQENKRASSANNDDLNKLSSDLQLLQKKSDDIKSANFASTDDLNKLTSQVRLLQKQSQDTKNAVFASQDDQSKIAQEIQSYDKKIQDLNVAYSANLDSIDKIDLQLKSSEFFSDQSNILQQNKFDLQTKNNDFVNEYNNVLDKKADAQKRLSSKKNKTNDLQRQLDNIQNQISDASKRISASNSKVSDLQRQSKSIQNQITDTQNRLGSAKNKAIDLQNQSNSIQGQSADLQNKLNVANNRVTDAINRCNNLQSIFNDASNAASTANQNFVSANDKFNQLEQKIKSNNADIDRLSQGILANQDKVKTNQKGVQDLSSIVNEMKQTIEYAYYRCYGILDMSVIHKTGGDPSFFLNYMSWTSYFKKCYDFVNFDKSFKYTIPTTIFSKTFRDAYGLPLSTQMQAAAKKDTPSLTYDGDFSCASNLNNLVSKKGTIKQINTRFIDINGDDNIAYRLLLSSCTRFDGAGENILPKIGSRLIWKASNSSSGYLLLAATLVQK